MIDTVVFDKTGTLTEGKPQVVAVKTFADVDEAQALRLAAALAFLCWAVGRRGAVAGVLARGGIGPLETWGGVAET